MSRLANLTAAAALTGLVSVPQATAEPEAATVGTAVQVVIHKSFTEVADPDQCTGAASLAAVRRGSSVVLSEASDSADAPKVAVGQFLRSRLKDGTCQVMYITSAPAMPAFNVQFVGPQGDASSTFGPSSSEPVTDQPGIGQLVRVDMEFEPQPTLPQPPP
ncbi:hypothetical protein [Mycolicibacterium sp. 120270]|uniref:hypothetical protein n=1 Tax=Mycolicibacterium sp. 120270 TaxID=3090600 RepID=UPI00299E9332|nr:hypothetical protein [Mycolicibacterium sp. 120270]MDX1886947.1 hypothetical protein [Mycolicibacterium sp. 120270]